MKSIYALTAATCIVALVASTELTRAQVGSGLADLNQVPESQLATMPGMTPAIAKAFVDARPFPTIVEAHAFLTGQKVRPSNSLRSTRRPSCISI